MFYFYPVIEKLSHYIIGLTFLKTFVSKQADLFPETGGRTFFNQAVMSMRGIPVVSDRTILATRETFIEICWSYPCDGLAFHPGLGAGRGLYSRLNVSLSTQMYKWVTAKKKKKKLGGVTL